jgi:hypothetical protein
MRIKSDVDFVEEQCSKSTGWLNAMAKYCGKKVVKYHTFRDDVICHFDDGESFYYPHSCLEEDVMLEKGKKYTVNGTTSFEFLEESENFFIFEGGIVFKKEGNEFVEVTPEPRFLNEEWEVRVSKKEGTVDVLCGGFYVAEITKDGLRHVTSLPENIGFALDNQRAAKLVKI